VSAPANTHMPPITHAARNRRSSGILAAIPAEDLKIPVPIVEPISTVTALNSPNFRGSSIKLMSRHGKDVVRATEPARSHGGYFTLCAGLSPDESARHGNRTSHITPQPDGKENRVQSAVTHSRDIDIPILVSGADIKTLIGNQPLCRMVMRVH